MSEHHNNKEHAKGHNKFEHQNETGGTHHALSGTAVVTAQTQHAAAPQDLVDQTGKNVQATYEGDESEPPKATTIMIGFDNGTAKQLFKGFAADVTIDDEGEGKVDITFLNMSGEAAMHILNLIANMVIESHVKSMVQNDND